MKKFCVLASGNGTNLQAIIEKIHNNEDLDIEIHSVVSDVADSKALIRGRDANIPTHYIGQGVTDKDALGLKLISLIPADIDLIVLAGYLRILSSEFVKKFQERIINIHPSLLPEFAGTINAIEDAFNAGVASTGVTVHWVTEEVDAGEIIKQESLDILKDDTLNSLGERLHKMEHEIYPAVIRDLLSNPQQVKHS